MRQILAAVRARARQGKGWVPRAAGTWPSTRAALPCLLGAMAAGVMPSTWWATSSMRHAQVGPHTCQLLSAWLARAWAPGSSAVACAAVAACPATARVERDTSLAACSSPYAHAATCSSLLIADSQHSHRQPGSKLLAHHPVHLHKFCREAVTYSPLQQCAPSPATPVGAIGC